MKEELYCEGVTLGGISGFDNPLARPLTRKEYAEGNVSSRVSYRAVWLDLYERGEDGHLSGYRSCELRMCSNGKCTLDGRELKSPEDLKKVKAIFLALKTEGGES